MDIDSGIGLVPDDGAAQATPRPPKRRRNLNDTTHFSRPPSPTKSESAASLSSHKSGRFSPVKQIQALEEVERPVIFCDFDSLEADGEEEHHDVTVMHTAVQTLADGLGILEYESAETFATSIAGLPKLDRERLQYLTAKHPRRLQYGSMPPVSKVSEIVRTAWTLNAGAGGAEDEWNTDVQHPLLKLALETCRHCDTLSLRSV